MLHDESLFRMDASKQQRVASHLAQLAQDIKGQIGHALQAGGHAALEQHTSPHGEHKEADQHGDDHPAGCVHEQQEAAQPALVGVMNACNTGNEGSHAHSCAAERS